MYKKYAKRLIDTLLSIIWLALLAPVFVIIAIAIKVDSKGPVFFIHKRLGKDGRIFQIIKFRTMVVGAENMGTGLAIRSAADSRITKVGAFLRITSLDELPQFINILKGDMSFVGPRPPAVYFPYKSFENYPEWGKKRFDVRPGLTGLSQVVYRNNASWDDRIKLDVQYVEDIKFITDVVLVLKTALRVLKREGIYRECVQSQKANMLDTE